MNQRNDTSRAMTQKQREAIMRLLPSTVGKMATALGLNELLDRTRGAMKCLS